MSEDSKEAHTHEHESLQEKTTIFQRCLFVSLIGAEDIWYRSYSGPYAKNIKKLKTERQNFKCQWRQGSQTDSRQCFLGDLPGEYGDLSSSFDGHTLLYDLELLFLQLADQKSNRPTSGAHGFGHIPFANSRMATPAC